MLLLACDFWAVKNITGRLLVGLRWWNEIDEEGNNMWVFEAHPSRVVNQVDSRVFWTTLYVTPAIWVLLGFITLIRLRWSWLLTVAMALSMTSANLVGYSKAHSKQTNNKSGYALPGSGLVQGFVGNLVTSRITGFFGGGNSNNSGGFAGFGR
ncbi:DUF846-domain-containing protein [Caulochytrium protostelioides]|uniref:Golgi apparatus membrane protein TVP23 n=1 Tax=Caulochytrium protostelioides TaxID=1555241 RepID=A0A4P9WPI9_9FUNG|nr:DUF846-domain-containing protein [Caulochytrium protostelioides]